MNRLLFGCDDPNQITWRSRCTFATPYDEELYNTRLTERDIAEVSAKLRLGTPPIVGITTRHDFTLKMRKMVRAVFEHPVHGCAPAIPDFLGVPVYEVRRQEQAWIAWRDWDEMVEHVKRNDSNG